MEKNYLKQPDKRRIEVKQEIKWNFINDYLSLINSFGVMLDNGFLSRYKSLISYVNSKLSNIPDGYDIVEEYVVVECEQVKRKIS